LRIPLSTFGLFNTTTFTVSPPLSISAKAQARQHYHAGDYEYRSRAGKDRGDYHARRKSDANGAPPVTYSHFITAVTLT
jgi:hypothetical protein